MPLTQGSALPLPTSLLLPLLLLLLPAAVLADEGPYNQSQLYDQGRMGSWPTELFRSTTTVGLAVNWVQTSPRCKVAGEYYLLAPRGASVHRPGPMILDPDGHLIWTREYGQTYNLNVQRYRGREYLTFWVGSDADVGHGRGTYFMLDSSYQEAYKFTAARNLPGDLHEFHITHDDTALLTSYDRRRADLSRVADETGRVGPVAGWIWEGTFQEVEVETGRLLFEWHASEHFAFEDVERGREAGQGASADQPWDFFHINSVDKDRRGNYLVSARYANCLSYVDGRTGEILWRLGGKRNNFTDLTSSPAESFGGSAGPGPATNFTWQHHARFRDNDTAITLFDNASRGLGAPARTSRGLYLDLDQTRLTVRLRHQYWNAPDQALSSQSQGSLQLLPNGNVLVGYGWNAAWTEFSRAGEPLCHVHFGPQREFGLGNILSYRVFKHPWRGAPRTRPDFEVYRYRAAASWNGATEVVAWGLEGTDDGGGGGGSGSGSGSGRAAAFARVTTVPKVGFETVIPISEDATAYRYLRVLALNASGHVLSASKLARWDPAAEEAVVVSGVDRDEDDGLGRFGTKGSTAVVGLLGCALLLVVVVCLVRRLGFLFRRTALRRVNGRERGGFRPLKRWAAEDEGSLSDVEGGEGVELSTLLGHHRIGSLPHREDEDHRSRNMRPGVQV
ncbi:arylsulfotransferase family protein [Aspergillus brunneoviolaceus CBS 621.78]|uniref:Uncharacterized protein n=1 Tax=Aspergillus brunneoviolaceus CBS 621.78 TaxID=1450534 RepID=A0ACD1FXN8_9EURO|nr:hypothetical protein BO95DRAFT_372322 [Aspergillus brunneoviolaceus CBS 621.78]RAH41772.1 hypothetical protein BO95DRAFT_372322 [Aspergillus brunneoviolaceus CBS 621.78]